MRTGAATGLFGASPALFTFVAAAHAPSFASALGHDHFSKHDDTGVAIASADPIRQNYSGI
ncbi:hypothetical protein [Rhizobium sp. Root1203]|uniref:hypothetical protein n=1 Tax=Rhizobium sp. Root1203 TaxID=1736427 RepID=UPI000B29040F|nr:hypothetical protein [Rhizobium sp. Root1203]